MLNDGEDKYGEDKYCVFRQGADWLALPAASILEVAVAPDVVRIPGADPVLAGLCHLRSEFIPVVCLTALAGEDSGKQPEQQQLLMVQGARGPWAVQVERVVGLETLEVTLHLDIRAANEWTATFLGSATLRSEVVRILDPARVYQLVENILRDAWAGLMKTEPTALAAGVQRDVTKSLSRRR